MSSYNARSGFQPAPRPKIPVDAAGPSIFSKPPPPLTEERKLEIRNRLRECANISLRAGDRYVVAIEPNRPNQPISAAPPSVHGRHLHPNPAPQTPIYSNPQAAATALQKLRDAEARSTYLAAAHGRPTTRSRSPTRTHSPTFPYKEYKRDPRALWKPSAIEAEAKAKEVYAIPASQNLLAPDTPTRCGRCLTPLRWGSALPSRCQQPSCNTVNTGDIWAVNEKFRQIDLRRQRHLESGEHGEKSNYLGEPIRYDELLQWRKEGSEMEQDPVDWSSFFLPEVMKSDDDDDDGDDDGGGGGGMQVESDDEEEEGGGLSPTTAALSARFRRVLQIRDGDGDDA